MPGTFAVDARDFKALSKAMRTADKDLHNAMRRTLRAELAVTRDAIRAKDWAPVEADLKRRWGKPRPIKAGKTGIRSSVSATRARVDATRSRSMASLNQGFVRHPLFGDRTRWYSSDASHATGWWDTGTDREAPRIAREAGKVLDQFATELARRIDART